MTKTKLDPETLRAYRHRANLSQEGLAQISRVSKKTIARIETGKSSANTTTVRRLAEALNVTPGQLAENPRDVEKDAQLMRYFGFSTRKITIGDYTNLALQMVERHYGISEEVQILMAPLFAALLAEGSLAWRKQKVDKVDNAVATLADVAKGHLSFAGEASQVESGLEQERQSIANRDIFGTDTTGHAAGTGHEERNPFSDYLKHLVNQSGSNVIGFDSEDHWQTFDLTQSLPGYSILAGELDRLTCGDMLAEIALGRRHVRIRDIPEHLLDDGATSERIAWLVEKVPQAEKDEHEKWLAEIEQDSDDGSEVRRTF